MARTVGSKNKNSQSLMFTHGFRDYWNKPEKLALVNEGLEEVVREGGFRDRLAAITLILKYNAIPLEKEVESETAISVAEMSKTDILDAIKDLKKETK